MKNTYKFKYDPLNINTIKAEYMTNTQCVNTCIAWENKSQEPPYCYCIFGQERQDLEGYRVIYSISQLCGWQNKEYFEQNYELLED